MKRILILVIIMSVADGLFALSLKEKIVRVPANSLPFDNSRTLRFLENFNYGLIEDEVKELPMYVYNDLGLTQQNHDRNLECAIWRKFQIDKNGLDLVALDISVSDWAKQVLAVYRGDELVDCLETGVCWYTSGSVYIKQWRINADQQIIVTHLKVSGSSPIPCFSDFGSVEAQRIDTYYEIDSVGKFHELRQVKYQPRTYTQSYLLDKTKNLWEGDEVVLK